jgi:hypothetical protein
MTSEEAFLAVIDALEKHHVPYMVVGSFSSNYYGIARSTRDADFVVQLDAGAITHIARHLGASFHLDPQMSFETATMTSRHILDVVGSPFKIELFHLSDDPHDQERFRRRKRVKLLEKEAYLPTAEDVIITKLRWAQGTTRSKDRDDIEAVLAVQGDALDWPYVYSWCDQHGTRALLDEIRRSLPPL